MIITDEQLRKMQALYDRIPNNMKNCRGLCEDSCTVIPCTPVEKQRIESATGQVFTTVDSVHGGRVRCSALTKDGRCSVYSIRPIICRVFGTVNHPFLRCEHGCVPERWLKNSEFLEIMLEFTALFGKATCPPVPGWPKLTREQAETAALLLSQDE